MYVTFLSFFVFLLKYIEENTYNVSSVTRAFKRQSKVSSFVCRRMVYNRRLSLHRNNKAITFLNEIYYHPSLKASNRREQTWSQCNKVFLIHLFKEEDNVG